MVSYLVLWPVVVVVDVHDVSEEGVEAGGHSRSEEGEAIRTDDSFSSSTRLFQIITKEEVNQFYMYFKTC